MYTHTSIYRHIHAFIYTYIHTLHACTNVYMYANLHKCMLVRVIAYTRLCANCSVYAEIFMYVQSLPPRACPRLSPTRSRRARRRSFICSSDRQPSPKNTLPLPPPWKRQLTVSSMLMRRRRRPAGMLRCHNLDQCQAANACRVRCTSALTSARWTMPRTSNIEL